MLGAVDLSQDQPSSDAFAVSILATSLALMALMYMRSSVVHRLRSAAAAEAEKHHS